MKKRIFITGVSSGIGEYLAKHLLANAEVYGASRNPSSLSDIHFFPCDLRDDQQIIDLADKLVHEQIDVFIFNAGIGYFGDYGHLPLVEEKEMLQVNLWANMLLVKLLLPFVSEKTQFIFMGSVAGKSLFSGGAGYQTSKFGLRGFVGALRKELGNRCFLINPKIVKTNFYKNSQISFDDHKTTTLPAILQVVETIIEGKQTQWEIDL